MPSPARHPVLPLAVMLIVLLPLRAAGQSPAIRDALTALRRGDSASAEQKLRAELRVHPNDASALSLLGVALDNQKKLQEADEVHRRAIAQAPDSADVLNNYANHLAGAGDDDGARKLYLQVAGLDPANFNANVQLARLALKRKNGQEALSYLTHLPPQQQDAPAMRILKLEALYLSGDRAEGDALVTQLAAAARGDLGLSFSAGLALSNAGQFDKAETFFTLALAVSPADFNVLANLGMVASHAGHNERAREVLETALHQQPENVEVLYNLAIVQEALNQKEAALRLLAQAARLAPQRADIQKLLAITTSGLGAFEDAAAAWERYLKLQPNDDSARRERAFTAVQMGQFELGIAGLQSFIARHPDDAAGQYELGMAESKDNLAQGLVHLDKALALKPDFAAARSARGGLYYQMGKPDLAVADLETAASLRPDDAASLDRLGQTYLALDRPADAVRVLRKAAALAPNDSKTQLHFARALADAGQAAESKTVMDHFRQLGPVANKTVPGLIDFLSLTPEQRHADYRARLEKLVREHPENAAAQVSYLKLLLEDGDADRNPDQASAAARRIAALKPGPSVLADAGRALLEAKQYQAARELLEQVQVDARSTDAQLDLAIATFHAVSARDGLQQMDRVPEAARGGDYYLARARMLDASGNPKDAAAALDHALLADPKRPDLYRQAAEFLIANGQTAEALRLLGQAGRSLPQDREILLMRAATLELAGKTDDAERLLTEMQNRWPEWHAIWVAQGFILAAHQQFEEGRKVLETAVALGARSPETYFYLADCSLRAVPPRIDAADAAIGQALKLAPGEPWIQTLAGRIAAEKREPGKTIPHKPFVPGDEPPYLKQLFLGKPASDW